jgi:hypothetical protein
VDEVELVVEVQPEVLQIVLDYLGHGNDKVLDLSFMQLLQESHLERHDSIWLVRVTGHISLREHEYEYLLPLVPHYYVWLVRVVLRSKVLHLLPIVIKYVVLHGQLVSDGGSSETSGEPLEHLVFEGIIQVTLFIPNL